MRRASVAARRMNAVECFGNVRDCIGPIKKGISVFAITRGQWSMIDAILYCLDQVGPSKTSFWTWTVAEYEVEVLGRMRRDKNITEGRMIIDYGARNRNAAIIREWQDTFGPESVRYVVNHAKMATIESESGYKLLLRGSMNLNFNPRFEQFDITEGGADFDLVRRIEDELPILDNDCSGSEAFVASKCGQAFDKETLKLFVKPRVWKK